MSWLYVLLIGLGTGFIMKDKGSSIIGSLVIAVIGAFLGGLLVEFAGKSVYGGTPLLFIAFAGAAVCVSLKRLISSNL